MDRGWVYVGSSAVPARLWILRMECEQVANDGLRRQAAGVQ